MEKDVLALKDATFCIVNIFLKKDLLKTAESNLLEG